MSDEKMINETEVKEELNEGNDFVYELEEEDEGSSMVLGIVGTALTALGGALVVKNKEKIKKWREERVIRKLEAKGYQVVVPETDEEIISEDVEETVEEN